MIKLILSANSPHSARFSWNVVTHVTMATSHAIEPTADATTTENEFQKLLYINTQIVSYGGRLLTSFYGFLLFKGGLAERIVEEPKYVYGPHEGQQEPANLKIIYIMVNTANYAVCFKCLPMK